MAETKPGLFNTDPKNEEVAVKDVYHQDVLKQDNTHTEEESSVMNSITEWFADKKPAPAEITATVDESIGSDHNGLNLNWDASKKRVERAFGAGGSTNGLSNSQKNDIGNILNDSTGTKGAKVVFKDVAKFIEGGSDSLTAGNIVDTINRITKQSDVFKLLDLEAEAAFILGISETLIEWGIPNLIDSVIQKIEDGKLRNKMLEEMAIRTARRGDLGQTKYFCEEMKHGRAVVIHKELIKHLCSRFSTRSDTRSELAIGNEMLTFFEWLNPHWDKNPADLAVIDLGYYTLMNQRAVEVLAPTKRGVYALTGSKYNIEHPMHTAGRLFPTVLEWS